MTLSNSHPMIVAVGASAGGLEAFTELLSSLRLGSLRSESRIAVVFVQHLDPNSDSLLCSLLVNKTAFGVESLTDGMTKLAGGCLYVGPPGRVLELHNGSVNCLVPNDQGLPPNPIDHFFHSVAEDQGNRGVGVILSGAGSDGTMGLKAISDRGGLTFAQSAETAKFDSMPRSAATTGVADHVLSPAEIAEELIHYADHLQSLAEISSPADLQNEIEEAISVIAETLMKVTDHNFQHYKTNTLVRRIQRRMQVLKINDVSHYVSHLQFHEEEAKSLFRELLIGVTAFFRDPDAFESLRTNVLPKLFENRTADDCVRIWVAGCANGSEAFTIAILCRELIDELANQGKTFPRVQIFATDIDERALAIAREGAYPVGIEEHVTPERLKRFFVKRGKRYQVSKEIRELVLFSAHNLISDPPFSRQDLICCRNLLIYLGAHLQNKLIPLFHYSLRPSGYLMLGPSENITSHGELFRLVDARHRISQRKGTTLGAVPTPSRRQSVMSPQGNSRTTSDTSINLTAMAQRIVLDEFAPCYAIIDDSGQILNSSANVDKYLKLAGGDYQNNILKMAASGLRIGLRAAIGEARKTRRRVQHENLSLKVGQQVQRVMLTVQPMPRLGEDEPLTMVVFHDVGLPVQRSNPDGMEQENVPPSLMENKSQSDAAFRVDADAIVAQLEQELETTRRDLDRSLEDMEAANEELKSSNEELLSMNEELQSANEELETSKEEIRAGSEAVARANDDLENLLRSTQIATVFLDNELTIRSFTPAICEIYSLIPTDVGRPLERFVPLVKAMPPLPDPTAVQNGATIEHTVSSDSGKSYIRRVLPYQSHTGVSDGIVVTFTDVTELRESEARFRATFENAAVGISHVGLDGRWLHVNDRLCEILGYDRAELLLKTFQDITHPDDLEEDTNELHRLVTGEADSYVMEKRYKRSDQSIVWVRLTVSIVRDGVGNPIHFISILEDITTAKQAEIALAEREAHLRRVIDGSIAFVGVLDIEGTVLEANAPALKIAGLSRDDVIGKKFWDIYWWNYSESMQLQLQKLVREAAQGTFIRQDVIFRSAGEQLRPLDFMLNPVFNDEGEVTYLVPSAIDIYDREQERKALVATKERLDLAMEVGEVASWGWDMNSKQVVAPDGLKRIYGYASIESPTYEDFLSRVDDADRDRVHRAIEDTLENDTPYEQEYQIHRPDGGRTWVRARGRIVRAADGTPEDFYGVVIDVTARREREIKLADREAHLRRVINNQLGLVGMIDRNGILLEVDDRSLGFAHTDRDQIIGKPFVEAPWWSYDPALVDKMRDAVTRAFAGETVRFDVSLFAAGEDGVMVDLMIAPVKNDAGEVEFLIPSGVDIRDRKASELALQETATRLEAIFETAVDGIITASVDGTINSVNQAASKIFGYEVDEMVGRNVRELIPELLHEDYDYLLAKFYATGKQNVVGKKQEVRGQRKDGSSVPLDLAISETDLAKEHRYVGIIRDITDRVRSERAIKDKSRRMQMALRAARMAAWEWTPKQSYWTKELYDLLGLPYDTPASSELLFSRAHPDDLELLKQAWQMAFDGEDAFECEFRIRRPNGTVRWMIGVGEVVRNRAGKAIRMYGLNWDSTQEHRSAEALQESERRAHQANASKSAFLANMSHEIRTPMTAILGYADLVRDRITDPEAIEHLQTIRRNGAYLLDIINDILDLSKIEADKFEVSRQRFNPANLVEDVRSIMEVRAAENNLRLDIEYDGKIPALIESDPKRLKQILINLLGNAIKFTRSGEVKLIVSLTSDDAAASANNTLQFQVMDTGIGMTAEQLEKLFMPFEQGDSSVTRHFGGTGLGLAISLRLAELLKGGIEVESELGKGSVFILSIEVGDISGVPFVDPSLLIEPTVVAKQNQPIRLDCSVLVVDDRRDIRFLSRRLLTAAGATVVEREDGQLAVDYIRERIENSDCPDLVLLDMQMPNLDGYETAVQLRSLGFEGPIIALTADAMQGDMNRCIECGCNDYLSKPIDAERLLSIVADLTQP